GQLRNIYNLTKVLIAVTNHELLKMRRTSPGTIVADTTLGGGAVTLAKLMKIECILCPTDLSPDSDEALRYAIALSRAYNAELILLHSDSGNDGLALPNARDEAVQAISAAVEKHSGLAH